MPYIRNKRQRLSEMYCSNSTLNSSVMTIGCDFRHQSNQIILQFTYGGLLWSVNSKNLNCTRDVILCIWQYQMEVVYFFRLSVISIKWKPSIWRSYSVTIAVRWHSVRVYYISSHDSSITSDICLWLGKSRCPWDANVLLYLQYLQHGILNLL